jgi:hypothetical protein
MDPYWNMQWRIFLATFPKPLDQFLLATEDLRIRAVAHQCDSALIKHGLLHGSTERIHAARK